MEVLVYFVGIFPYIWPLIVPCLPYFRTSPRRIRMVHPFLTVPCAVLPAMLCSEFQLVGVHVGRQRKARPASKKNPFQDGGFCRSHQFRPPKRSTCKPHYVCIFIYLYYIYIHIMFRLRPCCSHFLKKDGILINHNPWLRKRTNELYKRRHCFVKVCCDSSQKHLQAKKSKSQACSGN